MVSMAKCSLTRGAALVRIHSRRYYSSSSTAPPVTVAKLLNSQPAGENVAVNGFIRSIRKQRKRSFAAIGDGTTLGTLQAVLRPEQAEGLSTGAAVSLRGRWEESPNPQGQAQELQVTNVDLLGPSDPETFPIQKKYQTPEYLRTLPHLRPRIPFNALMLRFRSRSIAALTEFFSNRDFTQTHPPIITSSDCEGAGEAFSITAGSTEQNAQPFFREPKFLTVSSQLHLEALAQSVGKVWTLSPTFRAEKSTTSRHLSEFYMLEAEVNFVDQLENIMTLVEDMLRHMTTVMYDTIGQEIIHAERSHAPNDIEDPEALPKELEERWQGMMNGPWPRITYTDAIEILQRSSHDFEHSPIWGQGLQAEHERFIASSVGKGKPIFVTKYPRLIKPFYMFPSTDSLTSEQSTVDCFDLLVPQACEIAGGSMREHRLTPLLEAMQLHNLIKEPTGDTINNLLSDEALKSLKWYAELRRWGSVPHGGFGLGFDRLLGYLAGVQNIRDIVAFPRWVGRCDC